MDCPATYAENPGSTALLLPGRTAVHAVTCASPVGRVLRWLVLALLLAAGPAAAEPAGRVLLALGEAVLVRADQESPLKPGTEVQSGDVIRTGDTGRVQLRLTDESLISLHPLTEFRIDEYRYTGVQDGSEAAFFSLLKGGLRTVAGLVGSVNRDRYALKVPTATIGRRGTGYTVVDCRGGCRHADGSRADDGTYGSVAKGAIAATNDAGEVQFDAGQSFYVKDFNTLAKLLPAPPAFLSESAALRPATPKLPGGTLPQPGGYRSGEDLRQETLPPSHPHNF